MLSVLIVDDTRSVHSLVKSMVGNLPGVQVADVYHGLEAIELLRSGKKFDLILLDWEMPVLNGPSTFDALQKMGVNTPVVMMTTKNALADIERMLVAGVADYLIKPFTVDILVNKIEYATHTEMPHAA